MVTDAQLLLRSYAQEIRNLDDPDETGLDEELVVLTRETIADREWTVDQQAEIDRLDELLVVHWKQFEDVLPNPNFSNDRRRWWWYLHEGPQVRQKAEKTAG
ncbi:MAG: hypothetical protein IT329_07455 [Caldilineaceae bacterium]|nr:hypothetical protein [Caldilineaceae bacterium]